VKNEAVLDVIKSETEFSEKYSYKFDSDHKTHKIEEEEDDFEKSDDIDLKQIDILKASPMKRNNRMPILSKEEIEEAKS
jgi:hypothetical protein